MVWGRVQILLAIFIGFPILFGGNTLAVSIDTSFNKAESPDTRGSACDARRSREYAHCKLSARASPQLTLRDRWKQERWNGRSDSKEFLRIIENRGIIFFGGIMNELAAVTSSYFSDNIKTALEYTQQVSYFGPHSYYSAQDNVPYLLAQILDQYEEEKKPLLLIGHSKGGLEALYTVLHYPELIFDGIVDRVVLIQAPLGGSPLAEKENFNFLMRAFGPLMGESLDSLNPENVHKELNSLFAGLRNDLGRRYRDQGSEVIQERLDEFSSKIYYVRGMRGNRSLSPALRMALTFCWNSLDRYGPNDGIILLRDQIEPSFGVDLGALEVDHLTLTISGHFSNGSYAERAAFTRALLNHIY